MANAQYILALDYGSVRIGVAIASTIAQLPHPLTTLANTNNAEVFEQIGELVGRENVGLVVVGLPRTLDGGYSQQTHAAEAFGKGLAEVLSVPVEMADETLTSVDAEAELAGRKYSKADIDALAATYILERYLAEHPVESQA